MAGAFSSPGAQAGAGVESALDARAGTPVQPSDAGMSNAISQGKTSPRRAILLAAAGATTVALAYVLAPNDESIAVAGRAERAHARTTEQPAVRPAPALAANARAEIPLRAKTDPFVATSFAPPPPPPPPVAIAPPPPPPKAPPLPFTFVGLLESGPKPTAFLSRGDALLLVSVGQIVDNDYRVESISPTEIALTYLPLKERQKLNVTGDKP